MVIKNGCVNKRNAFSHVLLLAMNMLGISVEVFQKLEIGLPYDPGHI